MLKDNEYEILKQSFVDSQKLFTKLRKVTRAVENFEYDESGLYHDDIETHERHWLKLSSKIVDSLSASLPELTIELLSNDTLDISSLTFNLINEEERSRVEVDFSLDDAIKVVQIS